MKPKLFLHSALSLVILLITGCEKIFIQEDPGSSPPEVFRVFWEEFDRHYSFFELKGINWDSVFTATNQRITPQTSETELFVELDNIVQFLEDGHVDIFTLLGVSSYDFEANSPPNSKENAISYLTSFQVVANNILYGDIANTNLGYISIESFAALGFDQIDAIMSNFHDKDGMVIDVRSNGGGNDARSEDVASRFTDQTRHYRRIKHRTGPEHGDFGDWIDDHISPAGQPFLKPTVVLTNKGCFSATEAFLLAMITLPHVTVVGDTTGGGSGNPVPRTLPNGWTMRLSNWIQVPPSEVSYEGIGLFPDVPVWITEQDAENGVDTILEKAIEILE